MKELAERLLSKREVVDDCWVFTGSHDRDGYGRIGAGGVNMPAHRAAWLAFRGDPGGAHVLHNEGCGRRDCFNPEHLHLGSHQENMRERDVWGHGIKGSRVHTNRLTVQQVQEARVLRGAGLTWASIAERFDVHPSTVRHAVTGRTWRHIKAGV